MIPSDNSSLFTGFNESSLGCPSVPHTQLGRLVATLANFIVLFFALVGNLLILIVVKNSKNMKNTTDIFIANMAFSDLIFPVLVLPRRITEIYYGERRWLISGGVGLAFCKTLYFLQDLSTAVSILSMLLITADRFYAIVLPLKRFLISNQTCLVLAVLTWVIGIAFHVVYFESFILYPVDQKRLYCIVKWEPNTSIFKSYYISLFVCLALIPFVLMSAAYSIIFVNLKHQQRRIGICLTEPQNGQRSMRQRRVLYLSFAIVVSFAIAWAPLNVVAFIELYFGAGTLNTCNWNTWLYVALFLAYASSAVNPIITFLFSSKFRMASKELVRRIGRQYVQRANQVTHVTNMELH